MKKQLVTVSLSILFSLLTHSLWGQHFDSNLDFSDSTQIHQLTTVKDDVFVGHVIVLKNNTLSFLLKNRDTLQFQLNEVESITVYDPASPVSKEDHSETKVSQTKKPVEEEEKEIYGTEHLFFSPTAYNLRRKKANYRNTEILVNNANYGLTDYLSVGVGLSTGISEYLISLKLKASYPLTGFLRIGAGARYHISSREFNDLKNPNFSSFYGVISVGTKAMFANFSIGYINKKNWVLAEGTYLSAGFSWMFDYRTRLVVESFFSGIWERKNDSTKEHNKQPTTYLYFGSTHFFGRHLLTFGAEIADKTIHGGRVIRIIPIVGYQIYF